MPVFETFEHQKASLSSSFSSSRLRAWSCGNATMRCSQVRDACLGSKQGRERLISSAEALARRVTDRGLTLPPVGRSANEKQQVKSQWPNLAFRDWYVEPPRTTTQRGDGDNRIIAVCQELISVSSVRRRGPPQRCLAHDRRVGVRVSVFLAWRATHTVSEVSASDGRSSGPHSRAPRFRLDCGGTDF